MIMNISTIVRKKFVFSTILTISIFLLLLIALSGRVVYSNNDDYLMSILLANGEKESLFLNIFLTAPLTKLYEAIPHINWFIIIQQLFGIISIFIINYVIICLFKKRWMMVIVLLLNVMFFGTNVFIIQWTQTTTLMSVSAILLLFFSLKREKRKRWRIIQIICGGSIFLIASFFRFDSLIVSIVLFTFAIVVWFIVECYKEHNINKIAIRTVLVKVIKNIVPLLFCILGVLIITFGLHFLSNYVKNSMTGFIEYSEYNEYRSRFNDYYVAPFYNNEIFYETNGIKSQEDLDLVSLHFTDKDFFDSDKMSKIVDYSDSQRYEGKSKIIFSIKDNVKHIKNRLLSLRDLFPIKIGNIAFLLVALSVGIVIILSMILFFRIMFKRNIHLFYILRHLLFPISITMLWGLFFFFYGYTYANWILLPLYILSAFATFIYDKFFYIKCIFINLFVLIIYCYQSSFRISFRVIYTFAIPALICMCVFIHLANKTSVLQFKSRIPYCFFSIVIVLFSFGLGAMLWNVSFVHGLTTYNGELIEYVNSHKEINFVYSSDIYGFLDKNYSKANCVPEYSDNVISYGDWDLASPYRKTVLDSKKVGNLFQTMINNDCYRLLLIDTPDLEYKNIHEVYYNNHYAGFQKIKLVKENDLTCCVSDCSSTTEKTVSVYKIILL